MTSFISPRALLEGGPQGLTAAVERLLWHLGFTDVRVIDGSGDGGADVLGERNGQAWVVQAKWSSRGPIDRAGVDDLERARVRYQADRSVLATNSSIGRSATARVLALADVGFRVEVWSGATLRRIFDGMANMVPTSPVLRDYQADAVTALKRDLKRDARALLILATGLGKTVVGGEVLRWAQEQTAGDVLVVAHTKELVVQLERAMWKHLSKDVPTQVLTGDTKPWRLTGATFATVESALAASIAGFEPSVIMVDETHHVSESGMYQELLDRNPRAWQYGVTATPWRGDRYDIAARFGPPSFVLGIEEGMRRGYLATVDYRLFVDNINWDTVREASEHGYTLADLNSALFLPQRDQEIVDALLEAWARAVRPRALIFCRTIEHAERMATTLSKAHPEWARIEAIHSGMSRQHRQILLNAFRLGRVPILTSVDVFNEGVDVPDVNIIAFLRVTHSRRIFIQQLGRGLRLRPGKERLEVLDFVSDIRRIAAVESIRRGLAGDWRPETLALPLPAGNKISFSDVAVESLMAEWIRDAASLETAADEVRLQFPEVG